MLLQGTTPGWWRCGDCCTNSWQSRLTLGCRGRSCPWVRASTPPGCTSRSGFCIMIALCRGRGGETMGGWGFAQQYDSRRPHRPGLCVEPKSLLHVRQPPCRKPGKPAAFPVMQAAGAAPEGWIELDFRFPAELDPAAVFEDLFERHGWGESWRNGVFDYAHYHSRIHEVLGVARGQAKIQFGGGLGKVIEVRAGDVAILPAGTGHQRLGASDDFLVVGAYPPFGTYDVCTKPEDYSAAVASIPTVRPPNEDPVYGSRGPLLQRWPRNHGGTNGSPTG